VISINVLGAPLVRRPDGPVTGRAAHRRRLALVAILAAARGRPVGRDRIIGLLWPEHPTDAARHTLSEGLYVLRKDLGEGSIVAMGDEVALDAQGARSDLQDFEQALEEERWEDAVRAYGGPFLDGFYVSDAPEFERWAQGERDRLARGYGRALEALATTAEADGAPLRAAEWWRRLLAHDAFSSRVALRLVRVLESAGERAAALRSAEAHVLLLREELGVAPDPELTALIEDLRRDPPPLPPRPPRAPVLAAGAPVEGAAGRSAAPEDERDAAGDAADPAVAGDSGPGAAAAARPGTDADVSANGGAAPPDPAPAKRRRRMAMAAAALGIVAIAAAGLAWERDSEPAAAAQYDPRRIAVLYLDDDSPGGSLQYLANGLTEMLIHELSQVEALDVVSRNGVKPYRQGTIPFDSMVAQLRVGSVVEGSVQRSADSVRVTVQLIDATSHSHLESRVVVRPLGDLFALERAVSEEVSGFLRRRLGEQVRLRQARAETRSTQALELVMRGEQVYADALTLRQGQDSAAIISALRVLDQADSLFARAEAADPRWARPTVGRAWVAIRQASWSEGMGRTAGIDSAVARAERVLRRQPGNARALEARGTALWTGSMDPGAEGTLLEGAERDLRAAVTNEPSLASAWGTLSFVLFTRDRMEESDMAARRALEYDAYLEAAPDLLVRRFYSSLGKRDYAGADEICARGRREFPRDWHFVDCRLTLLREDMSRPPDTALAWRLVAELETMDPPVRASAAGRVYAPIYRRMSAAMISVRAGDAGRARAVLARARLDAAVDPESQISLVYDEARLLLLLGDSAEARRRLDVYLAQRPSLRDLVRSDPLLAPLLRPRTAGAAP
jgi:DNA-binding SARP family transcriptional activator/TolB-like protein/tetratricopeptide (TPR) repeat protein